MKNSILTLFSLVAIQALTYGQQEAKTNDGKTVLLYEDGTWFYADSIPLYNLKATSITKLELPKANSKDKIITHTGYSLLFNETHEQANWVAYDLTKAETNKLCERTNKFIADPKVKTGSASDKDYEGSGYDRGHLAPASDMGWSSTTMAESFYYSNMSPQTPSFNRGIWKKLEELVRTWAIENNTVYIVTGPVLTNGLQTIGPNKVSVPNYYYKVVLDYSEPNIKGIGFILPNIGSEEQLQYYAVSIDSVEKLTGIDFFPLLQDEQEELIEKTLCINCWSWKSIKTASEKNKNKATESAQCNGITKAGERCKNKTLNHSGYCYHHEGQINSDTPKNNTQEIKSQSNEPTKSSSTAAQCSGTTKSGSRCKRRTTNSSGRCYQH
ncbi:MAG: DNA/RNA non-specific endonuclease [Flavobacteriaceae bacterium]|nr:DNA/RNA non-specific endonuclease [Flavobacteriaceae bacterium]